MTRRWAKLVFLQSTAAIARFNSDRRPPQRAAMFLRRRRGFSSSADGDDLFGLADSDFSPPAAPDRFLSPKDFAFLNEPSSEPPREFSSDAVAICEALMVGGGGGIDAKTEKSLRHFRGKLSESLVIEVLKGLKSPELGVKFFVWAGRQIGYQHKGPAFHALLDALGFGGSNVVSDNFLREIRDEDAKVLGKLLNVIVRKCCKNGMWNQALEELGRLKDFGCKPTKLTYNALIQVLLSAEKLDSAVLVHREMSDAGFVMDGFTLGSFARSLCKVGRWREALSVMEKEEYVPDAVIYTKMISGLCEASLFEEAVDFLHRMRSNSCLPNVVTYTTLLGGLLKKRQLGRCKRIINMMVTEGFAPSLPMLNSLVHGFCTLGDHVYAYKLLKKMEACGLRPGYVVYNILIGGVCGNDDNPGAELLDLAERVYAEMLENGIVLNKINVANFARCLCAAGKFEKAFTIIREMMSKGLIPDTSTYSKVIEFLCQADKVEAAFLLFEEMKMNGIEPDVYTYTILIDSFCKAGLIQQARNWFYNMVKDGCAPNVVTFTALIHAYLKARQVSQANKLFESMLSLGCVPNVVTYSALIDGLCKAGEVEKACQIYARMKGAPNIPEVDMYFNVDDSSLIEPNVFTYGALINGLCKKHRVVEASDLLEAMEVAGCEPNQVIYDALIDGFCKVGKLEEAQHVFGKMSERGYSPNVYTYSSLIDRLFKDKRLDLALKVLSKMLEDSCPPNVVTYTEMIDGLCKVGKTEEAHKLLLMMEEKGCHPNVVTYTAMIDGLGRAGKVDMSIALFREMTAKSCSPNFVTYRILINHCCAVGLLDEAHSLLDEMKQTYWPIHLSGYSNVMRGFSNEFIMSLGLLEEISNYENLPLVPSYNIVIDSFCKAGRLSMALNLYRELLNTLPFSLALGNIILSSSLIESLCLAHKLETAFELYGDITKRGYIPQLEIIFYLIKGLLHVSKWEEALLLSHSICNMVSPLLSIPTLGDKFEESL